VVSVVAGFEPFDGRGQNRSWEVVRRVAVRPGLETVQLPVDYARLRELVPGLASRQARRLLLIGESAAGALCVEQVALNVLDRDRPDSSGSQPSAEAIVAGGPLALRAPWDARAVARRLNEAGIAATASFHAGTFACNAALYLALHALGHQTAVGFLHVPYRRWPLGVRLGLLLRAVDLCLEALAQVPSEDSRVSWPGGRIEEPWS
jgi:pyroglutamyl-peptidase